MFAPREWLDPEIDPETNALCAPFAQLRSLSWPLRFCRS